MVIKQSAESVLKALKKDPLVAADKNGFEMVLIDRDTPLFIRQEHIQGTRGETSIHYLFIEHNGKYKLVELADKEPRIAYFIFNELTHLEIYDKPISEAAIGSLVFEVGSPKKITYTVHTTVLSEVDKVFNPALLTT